MKVLHFFTFLVGAALRLIGEAEPRAVVLSIRSTGCIFSIRSTAGRRRHSACRRGVSHGTPAHVPGIARVEAHRPCAGTGVRGVH